jgi:hypothetical protein
VSYVSAEKFFPNGEQVQITATVGSEGLLVTCSDNKTPEGYDANVSQKRAVTIGGSEATTGPEDTGMANELLGRIMGWTVITQEAVVRDETVMKSPEGTC